MSAFPRRDSLASDAFNVTREQLARRIRVVEGREPGDLLLHGGRVVNVFTCEVERANVVVADGYVAGVGPYDWTAGEEIDMQGQTILPGLIDAHMHVESTLLMPAELARLVVPHGTSAVVADPHEIGNVLGVPGVDLLLQASDNLPMDFFFMAPSCVPATAWEDAGAVLDVDAIERLLSRPRVLGLAEMMDFPSVLNASDAVLEKVLAAAREGRPVDGHAPGVTGRDLCAYVSAGIRADHESTEADEALQKARLGMLVQVREGSSAHNLDTLLPLMVEDRLGDWCLATDDIHPDDLERHGHLDGLLRRVVAAGVPAARAVRHATLVPARHYGFKDRGAVAPAHRADLCVVDDLAEFRPRLVVKDGQTVARDGSLVRETGGLPAEPQNTVHLAELNESDFRLSLQSDDCPAIGIVPHQIVTRRTQVAVRRNNGVWEFDAEKDVVMLASIERHRGSGRIGLGLVSGFEFRRHGALASTVAHDSHNVIVAGTNPRDMLACATALEEMGGGFVAASGGQVAARLPLPVAGLISPQPYPDVIEGLKDVRRAAAELGCPLEAPFGTLSFLALPVIPELRITARGLFHVSKNEWLSL